MYLTMAGFERSNATVQWTVAGEGLTEPNRYLRKAQMQTNPDTPTKCDHFETALAALKNPFLKRDYGLPRRFAPRNDSLNLTTLPPWVGILYLTMAGFERSNATVQWTVAGEGLTEPNRYLRKAQMQTNPDTPTKCDHFETALAALKNPFLKRDYGLPRRFAPRNDSLNLTTLTLGGHFVFNDGGIRKVKCKMTKNTIKDLQFSLFAVKYR